jgi:hypothetical protein
MKVINSRLKNAIQELLDVNPDIEYVKIEPTNIKVKLSYENEELSARYFEPESLVRVFLENIFTSCEINEMTARIESTGKFGR